MVLSFLFGKVWPRLNGEFFRQNQDNIGVHEAGARSCNKASLAKLKDRYVINCDSQKQNISGRFWHIAELHSAIFIAIKRPVVTGS